MKSEIGVPASITVSMGVSRAEASPEIIEAVSAYQDLLQEFVQLVLNTIMGGSPAASDAETLFRFGDMLGVQAVPWGVMLRLATLVQWIEDGGIEVGDEFPTGVAYPDSVREIVRVLENAAGAGHTCTLGRMAFNLLDGLLDSPPQLAELVTDSLPVAVFTFPAPTDITEAMREAGYWKRDMPVDAVLWILPCITERITEPTLNITCYTGFVQLPVSVIEALSILTPPDMKATLAENIVTLRELHTLANRQEEE